MTRKVRPDPVNLQRLKLHLQCAHGRPAPPSLVLLTGNDIVWQELGLREMGLGSPYSERPPTHTDPIAVAMSLFGGESDGFCVSLDESPATQGHACLSASQRERRLLVMHSYHFADQLLTLSCGESRRLPSGRHDYKGFSCCNPLPDP